MKEWKSLHPSVPVLHFDGYSFFNFLKNGGGVPTASGNVYVGATGFGGGRLICVGSSFSSSSAVGDPGIGIPGINIAGLGAGPPVLDGGGGPGLPNVRARSA